jgi:hypothetical protein
MVGVRRCFHEKNYSTEESEALAPVISQMLDHPEGLLGTQSTMKPSWKEGK